MFKVLIVDDERFILDGLAKLIDWNALGYKICGLYCKSSAAMDFALKDEPNLIITDIEMPGMTGLEMMASLRSKLPDTKFIILSAYDLFDYAQKAVELGAYQYLLKPINREKLTTLLLELKDLFIRQQEERSFLDGIASNIDRNNRIITSYLVKEVFQGKFADLDEETKKIYLSIKDHFNYQLVFIRFCCFLTGDGNYIYAEPGELKNDIHLLQKNISPLSFPFEDSFVFVGKGLSLQSPDDLAFANKNPFTLGISEGKPNLENAHEFFKKAYHEFSQKCFYADKKSIFQIDGKLPDFQSGDLDFLDPIREKQGKQLLYSIATIDMDMAKKTMQEIEKAVRDNGQRLTVFSIRHFYHDLFTCIKQEIDALMSQETDLPPEKFSPGLFLNIHQIDDLFQYANLYTDAAVERLAKSPVGSRHMVNEVKNYVKSHFTDQHIKLNMIADKYFINYSYLSYIFKKQTGVNFYNYLLDIRMNEAVRLLKNTDLSINEIALKTGYPDSKNFHHLFKKHMGISPNKYRQEMTRPL